MNKSYYLLSLEMTDSLNSRWWSSKPEVPIFQLEEELATRFQIIIPRFRGRANQWRHFQHCHTTTEVGIQYGGRQNRSTYISACGGASNAISNPNTTFLGSGNSVAPLPTLPHHNGSGNSR